MFATVLTASWFSRGPTEALSADVGKGR